MTNFTAIARSPLYRLDVANDLNPHAQCVSGQIGDRRVLDFDQGKTSRISSRIHGPMLGQCASPRDRLRTLEALKYLVNLTADLRYRGADRIGAASVLDTHDPAHAFQSIRNEEATAAHCEQHHVACLGLD